MSERISARVRDWIEPAHPAAIRLYDDLIKVYQAMRQRQKEIDAAFDRVASQIGYIVTTTIPVRVEVDEKSAVKHAQLDGEALKGTLFEKELSPFIEQLTAKPFGNVPAGTYRFYLIWYDALRLKLRRDWMEPAHVFQNLFNTLVTQSAEVQVRAVAAVRPEVQEPAHWFDPGTAIAIEDVVVISAIDEVYPELKLAERISAERLHIRRIRPEVMEPVHFRQIGEAREREFLSELKLLLTKYRS